MNEENKQFMQRAIELARKNVNNNHGGPFGAVVVKDGKIIAEGSNQVTATNDPTAHAEMVAIREACTKLNNYQLTGCELYASCEPCPMCFGAIYWARPDKVYFAASAPDAEKADFDDSHIYNECKVDSAERKIPFKQIMRKEAVEVFNEWIQNEKKVPY